MMNLPSCGAFHPARFDNQHGQNPPPRNGGWRNAVITKRCPVGGAALACCNAKGLRADRGWNAAKNLALARLATGACKRVSASLEPNGKAELCAAWLNFA
jgi:hypothetical protein